MTVGRGKNFIFLFPFFFFWWGVLGRWRRKNQECGLGQILFEMTFNIQVEMIRRQLDVLMWCSEYSLGLRSSLTNDS